MPPLPSIAAFRVAVVTTVAMGLMLNVSPGLDLSAEEAFFFEKKVQPILSIRCYECHSHSKEMKGGLTLDSKSGWEVGGDNGPAIIPGKPTESLLIVSLHHTEEDLKMPPKNQLSLGEIDILTQWVAMGAPDPRLSVHRSTADLNEGRKHWAFQPVSSSSIPQGHSHPVDAFIQERLQKVGLKPSPKATRLELIRRATYDLWGLPPSQEEIEQFLKDPHEESLAFAKVIDRLLASPYYGEKWGRHWLDVMRYADSTGCSSDWPIDDAWRYRDWVIKAINQDKPFDEFITEQLAGDLLATDMLKSSEPLDLTKYQDRIIATGFIALSKRYSVAPGTVPHLTIGDTLDQTWQALQGLSLSCARCHDHKFDPIPTADYYALYGIFDSSVYPYAGAENNQMAPLLVALDPPEKAAKAMDIWTRKLPGPELEAKPRTVLLSNASRWGFEYHEESNAVADRLPIAPWISSGGLAVIQNSNSPFHHLLPHGIKLVHFQGSFEDSILKRRVRWSEPQKQERSIAFDLRIADLWNPSEQRFSVSWKSQKEDQPERHLMQLSENGKVSFFDGAEAIWDTKTWYHLQLTTTPRLTQLRVYHREGNCVFEKTWDHDAIPELRSEGDLVFHLASAKLNGSRAACVMLDNVVAEARQLPTFVAPPKTFTLASSIKDSQTLKTLKESAQALYQQELKSKPATAFAMWEGTPKNSAVQKRGELRDPGAIVERGNLQILGGQKLPFPDRESGRRELAAWLLDKSNPLTLRVFLNRVWQWHFGEALVRTPNDFGHTGSKPTHPELLDHLVQVFQSGQLSLKHLHRYLMLSETYQQSANASVAAVERDPDNLWLSHYSPRRLLAEELRDSILKVSGLLEESAVSKPHPFPPYHLRSYSQHKPFSLNFEADYAEYEHNRRSLYLPSIRLLPDPFLSLFDAADSNLSVAKRGETNSPLQGLALMNSNLVIKASQQLAVQTESLGLKDDETLEKMHCKIFGISSSPTVQNKLRSHYQKLLSAPGISRQEALSIIAQSLLSSNAFLYPF